MFLQLIALAVLATVAQAQPCALRVELFRITPACGGGSTGIIDIDTLDGTQPYDWRWSNGDIAEDQRGVPAGSYSVTVNDANGCTFESPTWVVTSSPSISLQTSSTPSGCSGGSAGSGTASVSASGGTAPLSYEWSNGSTQSTATQLPSGTYSVTVTDAAGCAEVASVAVGSTEALSVVATVSNAKCTASSGGVALQVGGGSGSYTFSWTGPNNFASNTRDISGVASGTYQVVVSDNSLSSCQVTRSYVVNSEPSSITLQATATDTTCSAGSATGSITLVVSNAASPVSYQWSNGDTTQDISGLSTGQYSVTVSDAQGCTASTTAEVSRASSIEVSAVVTGVGCNVTSDNGAIDTTVSGGTAPYTYAWTGPNGFVSTQPDLSGLSVGDYMVTITDSNSNPCVRTAMWTVERTSPTFRYIGVAVHVSCNGGSNGGVNADTLGGVQPYYWNWSDGSVGEDLVNVAAGVYTVTVHDANECYLPPQTFTVTQPAEQTATLVATPTLCGGSAATGSISVTNEGGTPGYTYVWSNGATTRDIANLEAGQYSLTITDAAGCTLVRSAEVTGDGISLSATITNAACRGGTGSIALSVTGGTSPIAWEWRDSTGTVVSTQRDLVGASPGQYTVLGTDANGCAGNGQYTIGEPSTGVTTVLSKTDATCFGATGAVFSSTSGGTPGYTYQWNNGATTANLEQVAANMYQVTVSDLNGCSFASAPIFVNEPAQIVPTATATDTACGGNINDGSITLSVSGGVAPLSYLWSNGATTRDISGLEANTYTVTVTDATGCTGVTSAMVSSRSDIDVTAVVSNAACGGIDSGAITTTVSGGTAPYTYSWTGPGGFTSSAPSLSNLAGGVYSATITDSSSGAACQRTAMWTVAQPQPLTLSMGSSPSACPGTTGTASVVPSGGTPAFAYTWSNGATTQNIAGVPNNTYSVTVVDGASCTAVSSVQVGCTATCTALYSECAQGGRVCCDGGVCARHARSCSSGPTFLCVPANVITM